MTACLRLYTPPDAETEGLKDRAHERLLTLCEEDSETGCWVYTGPWQPRSGMGVLRVAGVQRLVHRVAAWCYLGGFELDDATVQVRHTCRVPACFNPDHLLLHRAVLPVRRAA